MSPPAVLASLLTSVEKRHSNTFAPLSTVEPRFHSSTCGSDASKVVPGSVSFAVRVAEPAS